MTLTQNSFLSLLLREVPSSSLNIKRLKDGKAELCRSTHMLKCMLENDVFVNVNLTTEAVAQRCSVKKVL